MAVPWLRRIVTNLSQRRSVFALRNQSVWDFWWKKWQWDGFFSELLSYPVSIIPPWLSALIYHLGDVQ